MESKFFIELLKETKPVAILYTISIANYDSRVVVSFIILAEVG